MDLLAFILAISAEGITDEQVQTALNAYIAEHPEAVTTVTDGSITKAKLDSNLQGTVDDVGVLKSAFGLIDSEIDDLIESEITVSADTVGYIKDDGTFKVDSAWHSLFTDIIPCAPGWKFMYKGGTYNTLANSAFFYTNGVLSSVVRYVEGSTVEITIPQGITGVKFQSASVTSKAIALDVERTYPSSINAIDAEVKTIGQSVDQLNNIVINNIPLSTDTVGYIQNDGSLYSNSAWHCLYTEKLPCAPGWKFRYIGGTYNTIANSVLFFNGLTVVSQERYAMGSDVEVTVPNGVDGVIFQTASVTSATISLDVTRVAPLPLENVPNALDKIEDDITALSDNAFYSKYQSIDIFLDETKYSKTAELPYGVLCPRSIPAYTFIESVKVKATSASDGYIIIADSCIYESYLRMRIVAMYPVTSQVGWNEFTINFNTKENDHLLIGFYGIETDCGDYKTLPASTESNYRFSYQGKNQYKLASAPSIGAWVAATSADHSFFVCYPFTVIAYTGIVPTSMSKSNFAYDYVGSQMELSDGTLLPKYKVINGKEYGFIGRWYEYTYNGNDVMVGAAAGAEVCFKVSGTESISINWTGDYASDDVYYCYMIDGGEKTRKNITQNTIALPDTDEHIVRIVCDSIPHNGSTTTCWINGYGFVFGGVESVGGTLKGIEPANKTIMFFGDSLTEGVRALGVETSGQVEADVDSATESYGWYACKYLWATPILAGFGSTGIIANGYFKNCINAINYLSNGIETPDVSPDLIVINHGHNDTGTSSADWQTAFNAVLDRIMTKYPGVQVVGLSPFNRTHADDMKTCCDAMPWCHYIDSAPWALDRYYVDGPGHLTAEGAEVCGRYLAEAIKGLQLI